MSDQTYEPAGQPEGQTEGPAFDPRARLGGAQFAGRPASTSARMLLADEDAVPPPPPAPIEPPTGGPSPMEGPTAEPPSAARHRQERVSSSEFLSRRRSELPTSPATWGWRGQLNRLSGGMLKLKQSPAERAHFEARADVQRSFAGPKTIVTLNVKGGVGKTTSSLMLGYVLAQVRGGGVLVWDNNETTGSLATRGLYDPRQHNRTARDLLDDLERFETSARLGDLDGYVRSQGEGHFDLLASDERAEVSGHIDGHDVVSLRTLLQRFYKLIVIDSGNNLRAPNCLEAIQGADHLMLVTDVAEDSNAKALHTLDTLEATGLTSEWIENHVTAVVVEKSAGRLDPALERDIWTSLASRCASVHKVPFEPQFKDGGRADYSTLSASTREHWLQAAAAIANKL